jgi:RHS repeat-associated protein
LVSFKLNGTPYFYTRNGQGDITGLIDASGTEVVKYTYDSWGKPISITGSLATTVGAKNPYRYRGYRYDTESGLYYLQSRYYDPSIKRFISADELIDNGSGILGYNVYSYCINNPVNMYDDDGYAPEYISKQYNNFEINGKKMKDISLGFGNIADHGCGVIAAFNLILSRSSKVTFNNVKRGLIWRGGLNAGGFLGINPFVIANYMRSKFWFVFTAGPITFLWGVKAELSESVIVLIKWSGKGGMHYIAGIGTGNGGKGGSFKFYNTGIKDSADNSIDGVEMSIWTFLDYVEAYGATPIFFIGVKGKKGWW